MMSSQIQLPATMGGPSALFAQSQVKADDMAAGVGQSFAILSVRGKNWRLKFRGEETTLMRPPVTPGGPPDGPRASVEVVIVKASPSIAKIFYKAGYVEGNSSPPECWSVDGVKPDPASPEKQCDTCAGCPHNVWGSKMTEAGKAGKACADSKRLVVAPIEDLRNELYGGPILMRIPAASLGDMANYSNGLQAQGYPYYGVVTSLSFDLQVAYPKIVFSPVRALNDHEAAIVLELQNDHRTTRILSEAVDQVRAEVSPPPAQIPQVAPVPPATPAPTPAVAPAPVAQPTAWVPPATPPAPMAQPMAAAPPPPPVTVAPPPPPPVVVAPPPPVVAEVPYQLSPDGLHRWRPGMAAWEPVPAAAPAPTPTPTPAPVATAAAPSPGIGRGRGRPRAAAAAPPSPAPTLEATAEPAQASVVATHPAPAITPPVQAAPAGVTSIEDSLDAKLAALM